jgi:predicted transcriptional regulator
LRLQTNVFGWSTQSLLNSTDSSLGRLPTVAFTQKTEYNGVMILHRKKKLDIIAHSLTRSGIPLWKGIPEAIVDDLKANGYVIKKKRK